MAAAICGSEKTCLLCKSLILDKKSYRCVYKDVPDRFSPVLSEVGINKTGYLCKFCINKLNKITRIDEEILHKIPRLKTEREEIIRDFKQSLNNSSVCEENTPIKSKRPLTKTTPTPRKTKMRRVLPFSPSHVQSHPLKVRNQKCEPKVKEFDVKICVKYGNNVRTRIVHNPMQQQICKGILNNNKSFIKDMLKSDYRDTLVQAVCNQITNEVNSICKKNETLFKENDEEEYILDWFQLADKIQQIAPVLFKALQHVVSCSQNKANEKIIYVCTGLAVLLNGRNSHLSMLQHIIGFILDQGGATKEVISILHSMGLSVSPSTIHRKKKKLMTQQEKKVQEVVGRYVDQRKEVLNAKHLLNDYYSSLKSPPYEYKQSLHENKEIPLKATTLSNGCGAVLNKFPSTSCWDSCLSATKCTDSKPDVTVSTDYLKTAHESQSDNMDNLEYQTKPKNECPTLLNSVASQDVTIKLLKKTIENADLCPVPPIEVLGDNVDVMVSPASMTIERQRRSWHWFLILATQKRVTDPTLPSYRNPNDILKLNPSEWLPNINEMQEYLQNIEFHVSKILIKYIPFLYSIDKVLPKYIMHEYMNQTSKKSVFLNSALIDESENTSEGMIKIMQHVHKLAVPYINGKMDKIVLGGDVLTNERALSAQQAMFNSTVDFEKLLGVIHRPEGLHRQMNFLLAIYQKFYNEETSNERGTLYQLRNLINRRDVTGADDISVNFRSHTKFLEDVIASYCITVFMKIHGMNSIDDHPSNLPVFSLMEDNEIKCWISKESKEIMNVLGISEIQPIKSLAEYLNNFDVDNENILKMCTGNGYLCAMCGKHYKKKGHFKNHLKSKHEWHFFSGQFIEGDNNAMKSFMRMAMLQYDTKDAFRMADGERCFRNAKFEWLYAGAVGHTKYKIWLWRYIAYITSILSPRESFEYKWNICQNLMGGFDQNIPNDNCVEIQVGKIKKQLNTQGANKSFDSAKVVALTTQVVDGLKSNLMKANKIAKPSRKRPTVDKTEDIKVMVKCLLDSCNIKNMDWESLHKFKDPLCSIDSFALYEWIDLQKKIAFNTLL